MGFIIIEHPHRVINHLQDGLDLIEMERVPADNPVKSRVGPSGPELIKIEEIVRLDNPVVTTPQNGSPWDVSYHLEITRTSGRESGPNPLHDLITIYDEEERSEVSLVTPMHITEEKDPEKASSLAPNAQIQSPSPNE